MGANNDPNTENIFHDLELYQTMSETKGKLEGNYVVFQDFFHWDDTNYTFDHLQETCKLYYFPEDETVTEEEIRHNIDKQHNYHLTRMKESHDIFAEKMDLEDAYACAYILSFYTGSYSEVASKEAKKAARKLNGFSETCCGHSLVARSSNGFVPESEDTKKLYLPILFFMTKAMSVLPYYWGPAVRCVNLTEEELEDYSRGQIICWTQYSSSKRGENPAPGPFESRNTYFHIHSLTGRSILLFSEFQLEDEVLFPPMSCFLVLDKQKKEEKHHIYLRQLQLGLSHKTILWVDDKIFDEDWENKKLMENAAFQQMNHNIQFICKHNTESAISFLKSPFGQRLKNNEEFRIVSDMNRMNEIPSENAGARFLKVLRDLGFNNKVIFFTSNAEHAVKCIGELVSVEKRVDVEVTTVVSHFCNFLKFSDQ